MSSLNRFVLWCIKHFFGVYMQMIVEVLPKINLHKDDGREYPQDSNLASTSTLSSTDWISTGDPPVNLDLIFTSFPSLPNCLCSTPSIHISCQNHELWPKNTTLTRDFRTRPAKKPTDDWIKPTRKTPEIKFSSSHQTVLIVDRVRIKLFRCGVRGFQSVSQSFCVVAFLREWTHSWIIISEHQLLRIN